MQNQVGYLESDRIKVNDDIFGKTGITGKSDIDTFGYRLDKLWNTITEKDNVFGDKQFLPYFENKLLPLLNQHVIRPVRSDKVTVAWTNNICESANHVLKTATTDTGNSNTNTVVSTDGTRTAQKTPSAGRKPGQRKRKCA